MKRQKAKEQQEIMTLKEAAGLLRLHFMTVYKLTRKGKIPAKRVGGQWRFSRQRLTEWVREGR